MHFFLKIWTQFGCAKFRFHFIVMNHRRDRAMQMNVYYFCHRFEQKKEHPHQFFRIGKTGELASASEIWNMDDVELKTKLPHWVAQWKYGVSCYFSEGCICIFRFRWAKIEEISTVLWVYWNLCPSILTVKTRILFSQKGAILVNFFSLLQGKRNAKKFNFRKNKTVQSLYTHWLSTATVNITFHTYTYEPILLSWWDF